MANEEKLVIQLEMEKTITYSTSASTSSDLVAIHQNPSNILSKDGILHKKRNDSETAMETRKQTNHTKENAVILLNNSQNLPGPSSTRKLKAVEPQRASSGTIAKKYDRDIFPKHRTSKQNETALKLIQESGISNNQLRKLLKEYKSRNHSFANKRGKANTLRHKRATEHFHIQHHRASCHVFNFYGCHINYS